MPNFTGKKGIIDEVDSVRTPFTSHTFTGFTNEDFIFIGTQWSKPQYVRYYIEGQRVGLDHISTTYSVATGRATGSIILKGIYGSDGINFIEFGHAIDGVYGNVFHLSQAIYKTSPSTVDQATEEQNELNAPLWGNVGTKGNDTLYGGNSGWNELHGSDGNDTLFGGDQGNFFVGGKGSDTMAGGSGIDEFRFQSIHEFSVNGTLTFTDTINNFNADEGDKITLYRIANVNKMRFTDDRTSANWKRGDIIFEKQSNGDGWILGNADKDSAPELKIILIGVTEFDPNNNLVYFWGDSSIPFYPV